MPTTSTSSTTTTSSTSTSTSTTTTSPVNWDISVEDWACATAFGSPALTTPTTVVPDNHTYAVAFSVVALDTPLIVQSASCAVAFDNVTASAATTDIPITVASATMPVTFSVVTPTGISREIIVAATPRGLAVSAEVA